MTKLELLIFKNKTKQKAALGSIIIAAVISLFKQLRDLPHYWRLDKLDFVIIKFLYLKARRKECFRFGSNEKSLSVASYLVKRGLFYSKAL